VTALSQKISKREIAIVDVFILLFRHTLRGHKDGYMFQTKKAFGGVNRRVGGAREGRKGKHPVHVDF
jgi:hypothetical protein